MVARASLLCLAALLCLFSSCGYEFGEGALTRYYRTITIPYVEGDQTGLYTAALIKEIGVSSSWQYSNCDGELILLVRLCGVSEENVGFRYDTEKNGTRAPWLIPTETRLWAKADVSVMDSETGCIVLGPVRLSVAVDFDHEFNLSRNGVNVFSLGQLTDIREAREAAYTPLSQRLARKIVDYVTNAW